MSKETRTLQAIKFDRNEVSLQILDQLLLPYSTSYIPVNGIDDAFKAIKEMQVRGAPAIAIVGAFAITIEIHEALKKESSNLTVKDLIDKIDFLISSRPTAVNLGNACEDLKKVIKSKHTMDSGWTSELFDLVFEYSINLYDDDSSNNFKIGDNGVKYIEDTLRSENFTGPFSIITICNTGSLATSAHGTALGIIRSASQKLSRDEKKKYWLEHVYPCETRPYNQGARLTTFELDYEKIPFTLICDNMVASLINSLNKGNSVQDKTAPVKFIIVGADRIVKNGDAANKIGTFQLATIAKYFNSSPVNYEAIKFIVAAPFTTIDMQSDSGENIVIEERPANELTSIKGPILDNHNHGEKVTVGIATPGINVWNPSFDVTPHELIDSIITEDSPVREKDSEGRFNL